MPRLQHKSLDHPDEIRAFVHGRAEITSLDEWTVTHLVLEPGWRWSVDVKPIVGTESCQNRHLGIVLQGRFHVETTDGQVADLGPGMLYEFPPGHDAWVIGDETFLSYEFVSGRYFALPPEEPSHRRLSTILFTDLVDSTTHVERLGDLRWRELLLAHNEAVRAVIDRHHGHEVTTTGDGFLVTFDSPGRAVRAGADIVRSVEALGMEVRIGVNTGEVEFIGGSIRGLTVHIAARAMSQARPGQIVVTGTTRDLVSGQLDFESLGSFELKGVTGSRELFRLATKASVDLRPG